MEKITVSYHNQSHNSRPETTHLWQLANQNVSQHLNTLLPSVPRIYRWICMSVAQSVVCTGQELCVLWTSTRELYFSVIVLWADIKMPKDFKTVVSRIIILQQQFNLSKWCVCACVGFCNTIRPVEWCTGRFAGSGSILTIYFDQNPCDHEANIFATENKLQPLLL